MDFYVLFLWCCIYESKSNLLVCKVLLLKFLCYSGYYLPCPGRQEFNGIKSKIKMRWLIVLRLASESDLEADFYISESTPRKSYYHTLWRHQYLICIIQKSWISLERDHHHHHQVLFPLREIGPSVLSLQVSRFFAQLLASVHPLNPSSPLSFSTVLLQVSLGRPLLRLPSGCPSQSYPCVISCTLP